MRGRVVFAAGLLLAASSARLTIADVGLDALRHGDGLSTLRCPARIAALVAEVAASVADSPPVFAELIDGRERGVDTLDLDLTEGGQPDRAFRVRFPPDPEPSQFLLTLFMNDGSSHVACRVRLPPRRSRFTLEVPLAGFQRSLGVPDFGDVDYILLVMHREGTSDRRGRVLSIDVGAERSQGALIARCR